MHEKINLEKLRERLRILRAGNEDTKCVPTDDDVSDDDCGERSDRRCHRGIHSWPPSSFKSVQMKVACVVSVVCSTNLPTYGATLYTDLVGHRIYVRNKQMAD